MPGLVPLDVDDALRDAQQAAERHASREREAKEYEHAMQWLALAYEISGIRMRLLQRAFQLLYGVHDRQYTPFEGKHAAS